LRENSSTEDTLTSLTQIKTSLNKIREMDAAIQQHEEEAVTEFASLLKLLTKKIEKNIYKSASGGTR